MPWLARLFHFWSTRERDETACTLPEGWDDESDDIVPASLTAAARELSTADTQEMAVVPVPLSRDEIEFWENAWRMESQGEAA